ncbi:hypothetical protein KY285_010873 [Solanum tuberosum]|nr:hypothetical protein KY289_011448 [Solanum tuberosum]KAH0735166.1 hypothetical protein KY285_010873 [Solanum tuberosum]
MPKPQRRHGLSYKWRLQKNQLSEFYLCVTSYPVAEYLQLIKSIAEELSLCGSPVSDVDLVVHVLSGVGPEFQDISAAIHARNTIILSDELQDKLLAHELYLKQAYPTFETTPITTNHFRKGTNTRSPYQQKQGNSGKTNQNLQYENANVGVPANFSSYKPQHSAPRQHFRGIGSQTKQWLLDTGASHHITNDLSNLSLHSPYDGSDELHQTNGSGSIHGGDTIQRPT